MPCFQYIIGFLTIIGNIIPIYLVYFFIIVPYNNFVEEKF